jgi:hypothetical protein
MNRDDVILILDGLLSSNKSRIIHISLDNKRFYNGTFVKFNERTLSFVDNKLGVMEILYSQIVNIEPFSER